MTNLGKNLEGSAKKHLQKGGESVPTCGESGAPRAGAVKDGPPWATAKRLVLDGAEHGATLVRS